VRLLWALSSIGAALKSSQDFSLRLPAADWLEMTEGR
jgi:hypothetical protein